MMAIAEDTQCGIPDGTLCVDCGVDTQPGAPNRLETIRQINENGTSPMTITREWEMYIGRDKIWKEAGMEPSGGCLCIGCLEKRLGRRLRPKDFLRNHSFLTLPGTDRMLSRQGRL
jgi:hypothetical protein